ncbi:hypothetical protein HPB47_015492 [Ixodes persulcatus]|uniref:Uncharacterized protein n=1 Tax=Ixodes persulcatus TaxID=34615 RepID=A0AC60QVZ1_IXOPE|nr:hypothetical protein HPB47_015492 [Ixodes persulcatus]
MIKVEAVCLNKHTRIRLSQPLIKNKAACNVLLSTAIVATGSSPYEVLRLLELINIQVIEEQTYFLYQTAFMQPAIEQVSIHFLKREGITIEDLVTDRHVTTKGHMKTKEPEIHHYSDPWHIAKEERQSEARDTTSQECVRHCAGEPTVICWARVVCCENNQLRMNVHHLNTAIC